MTEDHQRWMTADTATIADDPAYWRWRFRREEAFRALVAALEGDGYRVRHWHELDPVLLRGRLPTLEHFTFESVGDTARVFIWNGYAEASRWTSPAAGWIDAEEAGALLRELVAVAREDACFLADRDRELGRVASQPGEAWDVFADRRHAFEVWKAKLLTDGFQRVVLQCMAVPVQLFGNLPTGEAFNFRCRDDACSLDIAPPSYSLNEVLWYPTWRTEARRWQGDAAGWLEPAEAEAVFLELFERYRQDPAVRQVWHGPRVQVLRDLVRRHRSPRGWSPARPRI